MNLGNNINVLCTGFINCLNHDSHSVHIGYLKCLLNGSNYVSDVYRDA